MIGTCVGRGVKWGWVGGGVCNKEIDGGPLQTDQVSLSCVMTFEF